MEVCAKQGWIGFQVDAWVTQAPAFGDSEMTAIGVLGTSEGLAIATDGRMRLDDEARASADAATLARETEHARKIFPIKGLKIAYVVTGAIASNDFSFDLLKEIDAIVNRLSEGHFDNCVLYTKEVSRNLLAKVNAAKDAGSVKFRKDKRTLDGAGWLVFNLLFAGYFDGLQFVHLHEFYHFSGIEADVELTRLTSNTPALFGSGTVRQAMYTNDGKPVPNSPFKQYVVELGRSPSLNDAERYVKGYVDACCSSLAHEMAPDECKMIGGDVQLAVIVPVDGFCQRIKPKEIGDSAGN